MHRLYTGQCALHGSARAGPWPSHAGLGHRYPADWFALLRRRLLNEFSAIARRSAAMIYSRRPWSDTTLGAPPLRFMKGSNLFPSDACEQ